MHSSHPVPLRPLPKHSVSSPLTRSLRVWPTVSHTFHSLLFSAVVTLLFPGEACTLSLQNQDCLVSSHYPDHTQAQETSGEQNSPHEAGRRDSPSSPLSDYSLPRSRVLSGTHSPCASAWRATAGGGWSRENAHTLGVPDPPANMEHEVLSPRHECSICSHETNSCGLHSWANGSCLSYSPWCLTSAPNPENWSWWF